MPRRPAPLPVVRRLMKRLPGVTEVEAWGTPTWRAGKMFAMYENNHHRSGRVGIWIKAAPGNNEIMVAANPKAYYIPPYVGVGGWIGVRLDGTVDWDEVAELLADGFRLVAPKKLVKELEGGR